MEDNPIRVLLIEDNPGDVRLIQEMLKEAKTASFDAECADQLSTGLECLAEGGIDIVLLDLGLPDSQRVDTFTKVHAEAPQVPVVVLTGLDDDVVAVTAVGAGAQDYLVKGQVDENLLARSIRYAMERKRAEEALREERDRAQSYLDVAGVMFVVGDPDGRVTLVNAKGCDLLGCDEQEIVGKNWFDTFLPERSKDETKAVFAKLMAGEVEPVEYYENPILTKGGEERIIAWHNTVLRDRVGSVIGALSSGEDITERKRAEEALQRLMAFNESIVQNAAQGIVVIDAEGYIAFTNPFADALLGYDAQGLVGQHWTLIVPPDQQSVVVAADERRARGESDRYELDLVRQDGTTIPVLVSGSPRFEGGRFEGTLAVFTDITKLKRAEERIRRRSEQLAALNAVATSVTSTLNLEQVVQIIEERVQTLLGERYPPIFALFDEADETFEVILTSASAKLLEKAGKLPGVRLEELNFSVASMSPELRGALLGGKPYVTSDASDFLGSSVSRKVVQAAQKALGIKSFVDLPLWAKGRLVGGMVLLSQREEISEAQIELLTSIGRHAAIAIDNATLYQAAGHEIAERQRAEGALRRSHQRLQTTLGQTVAALAAAVEVRDPYTAGHQHRTADLAVAIAEEMGLPEEQIRGIQMAGSVHDIGKIQIPAEILSKPTRLTEVEWALIKIHPQAGYDILREIDFPWPVARTVLEHHERMDGSGYPQGLSGEDTCVEARILAVADVVEAMASHRPYRPAHAIEEALEELQENRGILYDAAAVDACVAVIAAKKFQFSAE